MKLIVGLGNPGKKFENTRHNVGFLVLDELKNQLSNCPRPRQGEAEGGQIVKLSNCFKPNKKLQSEILEFREDNLHLLLVRPLTFMNESGRAVKKVVQFSNLAIEQFSNLYVIHDDLDIPLGEYKIQFGKGPKVHNGILSIEKELKTKDFWRVRVGIENRILGYKDTRILGEKYVLGRFSKKEREILDNTIKKIVDDFIVILSPDVRSGRRI